MDKSEIIKEEILDMGAVIVGFADVSEHVKGELNNFPYGISFGVKMLNSIINQIEDKPTHTYYHHYRSANFLIDQISFKVANLIEKWGYEAVVVPASQSVDQGEIKEYRGIFPHKTAATLAGLGWVGKSGLLVTKEYGPRIRLGTILTNLPLPTAEPILEGECGDCRLCAVHCPAMAIQGDCNWMQGMDRNMLVDAKACSQYMSEKFRHIGRGSVCGVCIRVCPVKQRVNKESNI